MSEQTTPIASPPPVVPTEHDTAAEDARRRLFELRETLTQRFDRTAWDEYVRLRRASR